MCSNTNTIIDCTLSRQEFALRAAKEYCKQHKKRCSLRTIEYFETDSGAYHKVRDILEKMTEPDFGAIADRFAELYPSFHPDWRSALKCGLLVKAGEREHTQAPYKFNDPLAGEIRDKGFNFMDEIITNIINQKKEATK